MKSIRNRLFFNYMIMILAVCVLTGGISFYYVNSTISKNAETSMSLLLEKKSYELNTNFSAFENNIKFIKSFIEKADIHDADFYSKLKEISNISLIDQFPMKSFFFCPDFNTTQLSECLYLMNKINGPERILYTPIQKQENTFFMDLSFDTQSGEKARSSYYPWLDEGRKIKKNFWMEPFSNRNIEQEVTSLAYVEPIFKDKEFCGVTGIEISNLTLRSIMDELNYEDAFCFLMSASGNLIYNRDFPNGLRTKDFKKDSETLELLNLFNEDKSNGIKSVRFKWENKNQRYVYNKLQNGMILVVAVSEEQLFNSQNLMIMQLLAMFIIALIVAFFIVNFLAEKIVTPIETINAAASYIAHGELNTKIPVNTDDELGMLAQSILKIESALKGYITHIRALAYTDSMTECQNKTSYNNKIQQLKRRIEEKMVDFTVYLFDINGLKHLNDSLGHEAGDELIKSSAGLIKMIFKEEKIFRIGGDEFVVITEDANERNIENIIGSFREIQEDFNSESHRNFSVYVSVGASCFKPESDQTYEDVFNRADAAMYKNKQDFYEKHPELRRM